MPEFERTRAMAKAIGRISCIETGAEIGLLYLWDNGDMQSAICSSYLEELTPVADLRCRDSPVYKRDLKHSLASRYRILL
jgi:hypothetical protein